MNLLCLSHANESRRKFDEVFVWKSTINEQISDDPAPRLTQHDVHWDHIALHGDCNFLAIVEANVDLLAKQAEDLRNELNQVRGSVGGLQAERFAVGNDFDFVATLERELLVLTRVI